MTKLLVCGSRSITDAAWVSEQISALIAEKDFPLSDLTLIEGGAKGVDAMGKAWAIANGVPVETHKADWARYGRGAGHRRNADMVAAANCVLILWDGISTGTKNDIDLCKKNNKNYKLVKN
ncbi:Protein of unknown function [Treponema bryantii]|uniref:YspA cpYpsA-related SLOG domain-containing protein n=1 Tax=Treponema bryantii TaxID=163 RepID=A0A1I3I839_9SPIR|nr:DUF2493 domain-containing protein [Treponema bryantii]SFI44174.1 Protein of unknown function [Treponema bryantii]